jgi:restriction system protein
MLTHELTKTILTLVAVFIVVVIIKIIKAYFKSKKGKGQLGEFAVGLMLSKLDDTYEVFHNLTFIVEGDSTQIDHIVISNKGFFIIETKCFQGLIFGQAKDAKWTQVTGKMKRQFQNPLRQNYKHIKFLAEKLGVSESSMIPIICFAATANFPKGQPEGVCYPMELVPKIKEYKEIKLDMNQIISLKRQLQAMGATTSEKSKAHLDNLNSRHQ